MGLADDSIASLRAIFRRVSILVLMDGARRPWLPGTATTPNRGFNPCFDGWGSPTAAVVGPAKRTRRFNPCFDGWGSPTFHRYLSSDTPSPGFNPCFDGWGSPTMLPVAATKQHVAFQSLF